MVLDVLVLEVEFEAAAGTLVLSRHHDVAPLMEWAWLDIGEVFLFGTGGYLDLFVAVSQLHPHLRHHCEVKLFFGHASEIDVVEDVYFERLNISHLQLKE